MGNKRKRLTLELASDVQERLQAAAARKGVSLGQYCRAAIDDALVKDDVDDGARASPTLTIEDVLLGRRRPYGDRVLPGRQC